MPVKKESDPLVKGMTKAEEEVILAFAAEHEASNIFEDLGTEQILFYSRQKPGKPLDELANMYRGKLSATLAAYENLSKCNDQFHSFRQASGLSEFKCSSCKCTFPYGERLEAQVSMADYVEGQFNKKKKLLNVQVGSAVLTLIVEMEESGVYLASQWYTDVRSLLIRILGTQTAVAAAYLKQTGVSLEKAKHHITFKALILEDYTTLPQTAAIQMAAQEKATGLSKVANVEAAIAQVEAAISIYKVKPEKYAGSINKAEANLKKLKIKLKRAQDDATGTSGA